LEKSVGGFTFSSPLLSLHQESTVADVNILEIQEAEIMRIIV
jgi:hypothetical protein